MARTSTRRRRDPERERPIQQDWFLAHERNAQPGRAAPPAPEMLEYFSLLWPASLTYRSPLNSTFALECAGPAALSSYPSWFLRDGLVPLLWFFRANPAPRPASDAKLWVHERAAPYVPNAWRSRAGSYRLASTRMPERRPRGLLLLGLMLETYCGLEYLQKQLDEIVETYGRKALSKMEIISFLPAGFSSWTRGVNHEYHAEYMRRICDALGTRMKSISWIDLDSRPRFDGFDFVELNEGFLCLDSFLPHLAASRGATPLAARITARTAPTRIRSEDFVQLSADHGFSITPKLSARSVLDPQQARLKSAERYLRRFEEAMRSPTAQRFPWPLWFSKWAHLAAGNLGG